MIENDDDLEEEFGKTMNRAERRKIKKMLKDSNVNYKDIVKQAKTKMKEPGFMEKAKGKSAWCMNNMHFKCQDHFTISKKILCQCECHNKDSIEKQ